jgi:hypothetical protein
VTAADLTIRGAVGSVSSALIQKKRDERDQEIVLRLLEHVETTDAISQDRFARQVGIAKGLANAYFNRCLHKGWIKLRQVPKQRFLYYLTPKGFAEKARITAQFLTHSYRFYRDARAGLIALLREAGEKGHKNLVVLGDGELAEISLIVSHDTPVEIIGFIAPGGVRQRIAGRPVVSTWSEIEGADGAVLATVEDALAVFKRFRAEQPGVPVFVAEQLRSLIWKKMK